MKLLLLSLIVAAALAQPNPETELRKALATKTGSVTLPKGEFEITREITLPADAHDLDIAGPGTTIKASAAFRGRALIVLPAGRNIRIHDISLDGNRDATGRMIGLAPAGTMYSRFLPDNGILAENVTGLEVSKIMATHVAGFAILVNAGHNVRIHDVQITESGGYDLQRLNNSSGGILLEEDTADFEINACFLGKIRGNGITIGSARQGRIFDDEFEVVARNAIQLSEANGVTVENNHGLRIGYPVEEVDAQGSALPSGVSISGNAARVIIRDNQFEQIDGRCMSLGSLNDGGVSGNTCSESLFGGIVLSGSGNKISGNHLVRLNLSRKNQAGILSAGIFLETGAKRNTVENNEIGGYGMSKRCVESSDSGSANNIAKNDCSDEASVARLQPATRH